MQIKLTRFKESKEGKSTLGKIFIDNAFECFSLEKAWANNLKGESRIIPGNYKLCLADWGDMNIRYHKRFGELHKGMIMLMGVPGRSGILVHMGTIWKHSEGCIMAGSKQDEKLGTLTETEEGYKKLYSKIVPLLVDKQDVSLEVEDKWA